LEVVLVWYNDIKTSWECDIIYTSYIVKYCKKIVSKYALIQNTGGLTCLLCYLLITSLLSISRPFRWTLPILYTIYYYIHKVLTWGILQSDLFSTSRILAHILLVAKNKMAAQTEFPTFANEKTASCSGSLL
jgi:hypothetical protein